MHACDTIAVSQSYPLSREILTLARVESNVHCKVLVLDCGFLSVGQKNLISLLLGLCLTSV